MNYLHRLAEAFRALSRTRKLLHIIVLVAIVALSVFDLWFGHYPAGIVRADPISMFLFEMGVDLSIMATNVGVGIGAAVGLSLSASTALIVGACAIPADRMITVGIRRKLMD